MVFVIATEEKAVEVLKQCGRQWYFKLDDIFEGIGLNQRECESGVYVSNCEGLVNITAAYLACLLIACLFKY